jgi:hypothetical protein
MLRQADRALMSSTVFVGDTLLLRALSKSELKCLFAMLLAQEPMKVCWIG